MKPYQQRVLEEKADLDAKLEKLLAFLEEGCLETSKLDGLLLCWQATVMRQYSDVLKLRIEQFGRDSK